MVTDKAGAPIPYASVVLLRDGTVATGGITDDDGGFLIKADAVKYVLTVEFIRMVCDGFGDGVMDSPGEFARYAQWISYDGYRAMYEANNAGKKGLLIWMSHSCWPSQAWQTYDYWFDRGGAFYGTKKGCEPLHIQFNPIEHAVQVCNYRTAGADNLTACISIAGPCRKEIYSKSAALSIGEYEVKNAIDCPDIPDGPCVMTLTLKDAAGAAVSDNIYLRNFKDGRNTGIYTDLPKETIDVTLRSVLR